MRSQIPLVIGNWKLNPASLSDAKALFLDIRKGLRRAQQKTEVLIAPPFPYLSELQRLSPSGRIGLAAQDVHPAATGAFTGEVSLPMLKSVGVSGVIIGHSERRAAGETDEMVAEKTQAVLKGQSLAIVCVGETKRDSQGHYFNVVESQLKALFSLVTPNQLSRLVIAYEPIWAIGTGNTATAEDAHEMKMFIQKIVADRFNRQAIKKIRILYGGSVKKDNAEELLAGSQVDGFLVGGASLKAKEFISIIASAETYAKSSAS